MIKLHAVLLDGNMYMSPQVPQIASVKNQWLYQQVDVEFPTQESLKGKDVYQQWVSQRDYVNLNQYLAEHSTSASFDPQDIYLVDFHRLTVMFALQQAQRWQEKQDQELIIEFLTQIIYSEPCQLFIGFQNGEPVATAIVTLHEEQFLISDLYTQEHGMQVAFINGLLNKTELPLTSVNEQNRYLEL